MGNANTAEQDPSRPRKKKPADGGALVCMVKEDPSIEAIKGNEDIYKATVWLPGGLKKTAKPEDISWLFDTGECLASEDVLMGSFSSVHDVDEFGNFLDVPSMGQLIGASALATVQTVMTMYRRALKRMGVMDHLNWQAGKQLLICAMFRTRPWLAKYIQDSNGRNLIICGMLPGTDRMDPDNVMSSAGWFDSVAHESGHGILHAIGPRFLTNQNPQMKAFSEAFGDITVILTQISMVDVCEKAIVAAKGELHTKTFFTKTGELLGELKDSDCTRYADNDYAIDEVTEEAHDLSQVFTGAFYDILVDIYDDKTDLSMYNPAVILYQTGEHMMEVLIRSIVDQPADEPTLAEMAKGMMEAEKVDKYKAIMKKQFDRRKMFDPSAKPKPVSPTGEKSATAKERRVKCGDDEEIEKELAADKEAAGK